MFELASGVAQEELALDPNGQAEKVGKEQSAIKRDAPEIAVQNQAAPGSEKMQFVHQAEPKRKKDKSGDKNCVGDHGIPPAEEERGLSRVLIIDGLSVQVFPRTSRAA
jgi:hypothetical protein